jgi:hypothetical protein
LGRTNIQVSHCPAERLYGHPVGQADLSGPGMAGLMVGQMCFKFAYLS